MPTAVKISTRQKIADISDVFIEYVLRGQSKVWRYAILILANDAFSTD